MRNILLFVTVLTLTLGCATTKDWSATGGSRADGIIKLSYEEGAFENAQLSEAQAIRLAQERCSKWGYNSAEAFGGSTRQCISASGLGGCDVWRYTKEYQCSN